MKIITDKDMVVMRTVEPNKVVGSGAEIIKLGYNDNTTLKRLVIGMETKKLFKWKHFNPNYIL